MSPAAFVAGMDDTAFGVFPAAPLLICVPFLSSLANASVSSVQAFDRQPP